MELQMWRMLHLPPVFDVVGKNRLKEPLLPDQGLDWGALQKS